MGIWLAKKWADLIREAPLAVKIVNVLFWGNLKLFLYEVVYFDMLRVRNTYSSHYGQHWLLIIQLNMQINIKSKYNYYAVVSASLRQIHTL